MSGHLPVPVGERHHDVEGGQEQHEVEEGVGVRDSILLVVHSPVHSPLLKAVSLRPVLDQGRLITGEGQLVHLGVGRVTDTEGQTAVSWTDEFTNVGLYERSLKDLLTWSTGHT